MAGALVRCYIARCGGGGWASPGGRLPVLRGASGVRRCPLPGRPPSGAGSQGSATRVSRVRSTRTCGPSTGPPHSVRPCGPALLAVGVAEGRPRGEFLPPLWGAPGVRRCPSSGRSSSGACSQGSATRVSRVRSMRACGPSTGPTACAFAGRRCSLWGWRKGVPGGGVFHRCEGRLVSGAVPSPAARPPERAARVPRPVCPGCGRCGHVDQAPAPQRAPLQAGVARCGGGGRASPGGVPSTVVTGAWCQALSLPRPRSSFVACSQGPATRVSRARSMRACGPSTSPRACALAGRHCSLWGWRNGVPGGGAFHRCEGRLVSGAVPSLAARPPERAARVPRPVCPGCGRCGRVDPVPAPQRAPLRAGVVRCGGGGRASPGGAAFHRCEGRLVSGAVPPSAARPWERAARVLRPACPGCGRCGRVDPAPAPRRAPLRADAARCGGGGRVSPGGMPSTVVRGAWCQALSLPWPLVLRSVQPGFRDPCVPGAVDVGVWTQYRPHGVRPCGPALFAVGVAEGRPWGGLPSTVVGGAWCQALSLPRPLVLRSVQPGFRDPRVPGAVDAGVWTQHRPHGMRPCGRRCSLWGWRKGVPRGGAFHRCEGRPVSGAVPPPATRPPERAARVPRPACPGCGRCGRVDPAPAPQRAPLRAGVARCGGGGRASPGGVPSTVVRAKSEVTR